jgi:hypothetical protein
VLLIYIDSSGVLYEEPVDDPIFYAHSVPQYDSTIKDPPNYYVSNYYAGVIGCAEQHQICHGGSCTPLSGGMQLNLDHSRRPNIVQEVIFGRMEVGMALSGMSQAISGRSDAALKASESLQDIIQSSLPSNQWEIELSSWFSTTLALLQAHFQAYASPPNLLPGLRLHEPETAVEVTMCRSQKTQLTNGTVSFSVLGLSITLVVGTVLILTSFFLETVVGWLRLQSHQHWVLDDKLQLQRMVFEARGIPWTNTEGRVPVTDAAERFPGVTGSTAAQGQALMGHVDGKSADVALTEVC